MTSRKRSRSKATKKPTKAKAKKSPRRRKLRLETPKAPETPQGDVGSAGIAESEAPSSHSESIPDPIQTESVKPEVGTLHPPSHGRGLIRWGNPGNSGGGRLPESVRRAIGGIVRRHGLDFLERVLSRQEVDYVPIKVSLGERVELVNEKPVKLSQGERVEIVEVPVRVQTVVGALAVALSSSEGMVAAEKPGLQKRRILEVRMVHE